MAKAVIALIIVAVLSCFHHGEAVGAQREFDFWTFSLRWAPTICRESSGFCLSNACDIDPSPLKFGIQGLWPDYEDGTYPTFCNCSGFDIRKIYRLIPYLEKSWLSLSCDYFTLCSGENTTLEWAYQWEKHGTCGHPVTKDEFDYFQKALELYAKYDVLGILHNAGIKPSESEKYRKHDIITAIRNAVGEHPVLKCEDGNLKQVQLCFTKNFAIRSCLLYGAASSNVCPENIGLPVQLLKVVENGIAQVTW